MKRNLIIGTAVIVAVVITTVVAVRYFKPGETTEQPNGLAIPAPSKGTPSKPVLRRPGPEPSREDQRRCMEKYPKDAFARHACEQGVIGISDEERIRKLDEAWNSGLKAQKQ